jgi:hypothetical protein
MSNNFLAEVADFFMQKKVFTTISSRPSSDPNTGIAQNGKTYAMRVKMYKSKDQATIPRVSQGRGDYTPPQHPSSSRETFTMYSRPTAFGPPQWLSGSGIFASVDMGLGEQGENYAFTPPYYYGEAWADISFTPSQTKKYTISEIIKDSTVQYYRYKEIEDTFDEGAKSFFIEKNSMDLSATVNLFSQSDYSEEQIAEGSQVVQDASENPSRWVIQTKFETPMLNFNHLSASDSVTLPNNASQSVPRGMWHQYGLIEEDPTKGIFLQVTDIPDLWIENVVGNDSGDYESLADLCGFSTEAKRLGEIADEKKISEAVVAVPFIEEEGQRKFFRIPRIDIERAFGGSVSRSLVGDSVLKMVSKMQNYVLPPPMDFINNSNIDPFAMYIFEFSHTLKKQDLANIWQNLYPEIGQTFETAESTVSHELLAHELLGGGAKLNPQGTLDVNAVGNEIPNKVRWMVFKVKQRAAINYNKRIIGRQNIDIFEENAPKISYNWPYDFFSLVELAKVEAEVTFSERLVKSGQEPRETIVPKYGTKFFGEGTSIDAANKVGIDEGARTRSSQQSAAEAQRIRDEVEAERLASLNEFGRTPEEAEERARLKSEYALGTGEYLGRTTSGGRMTKRMTNSDYDGDGKRDPEDGGYDPTDINNDGSTET